ncbi:MAG: hypothetical protein MJZ33_08585 [Paludibacteraceae bacterium]|nr:hypothetical protein [Paludibacteraceae bacterium]
MDQKVKFATLMAKLGVYFGAADGDYSDKEKAFVNLFIGLLKTQGNIDMGIEEVIRSTTDKTYTLDELVAEAKEFLQQKDTDPAEVKTTIKTMNQFIETVIQIDGTRTSEEDAEFAKWQKAIGA